MLQSDLGKFIISLYCGLCGVPLLGAFFMIHPTPRTKKFFLFSTDLFYQVICDILQDGVLSR